ncbi:MAG TPA: penicillin-binding protein 1C, partial [Azospirillaceae bacterium]|nr:penicillin-binding protein 1C [Azospirillaceae bacterium]
TMQVARLLEPHPRTLVGKLREMVRAVQLERRYDKRAILGMYLTLAPFGGNIEGARAASMALFGKAPRDLTPAEAALLVALPQAPGRLRPDRATEAARLARDRVLARGQAAGILTAATAAEAREEPVPERRLPFPQRAFHLADRLRAEHPGRRVLRSTLDAGLQRAVEDLAREEMRTLHPRAGLAILVVDNASRAVVAHIGAPDPFNERRLGAIDMTRAVRSPGSALKPFIYGLGFDDGVIHPETRVADVSTRFGDYAPANFDDSFHGDLTVREALQRSLNVPAVLVLDKVGPMRFAETLRRAGARLTLPPGAGRPGLPLALGGVGISPWDLATLYVGLARDGYVAPLHVMADTPEASAAPLMTATSATQVAAILAGTPPPPGLVRLVGVGRRSAIAVKTGTSFGFRDAWAFGMTARWTVGVWVGRPDGTPSPDRYGRNTAAPVLHAVFDRLPDGGGPPVAPPLELTAGTGRGAPDLLRRVEAGTGLDRPIALPDPDRLRLTFPTPGAVIDLSTPDGDFAPVVLSASGGRRPFTWVVNGHRMEASPLRREMEWQPEGPGFARVVVIDGVGRAVAAEFRIR